MSATVRGKHSGRDGQGGADDQREKSKLERGGIALENDAAHRRLKFKRLPEIAAHELLEIVAVLHQERLIEIQCMTKLRDFPGRGALP